MIYNNIIEGRFIRRINRFIAEVEIEGIIESVHVKNTGRCEELFVLGAKVYLEKSNNLNRKTKYSLISIYKNDKLINIDSQVPNQVVYDAIINNYIPEFKDIQLLKREVTYGHSRFDLYFERENKRGFIEVKGVTLELNGLAKFPDAPTARGSKHLKELISAKNAGYKAYIFFLVQMDGIKQFTSNRHTDALFSDSLKDAINDGVKVLVYNSKVNQNSIEINKKIEMISV